MKKDHHTMLRGASIALVLTGLIGVHGAVNTSLAQSEQKLPASQSHASQSHASQSHEGVAGEPLSAPSVALFLPERELSPKEMSLLQKGSVLVDVKRSEFQGEKTTLISAAIDIAAPADIVWRVMVSCDEALEIVPHIQSCDVIDGNIDGLGEVAMATQTQTMPIYWDVRRHIIKYSMLFPKTVNEFRSVYTPNKEIVFEKSGGDLKVLQGRWRLQPVDGGKATRVVYGAQLAIGQPVPGFILRRITNGDTKDILRNLRDLSVKRTLAERNTRDRG